MTLPIVFLGPSLPLHAARELLPDAEYLPPCRMGDVYAACRRQPRAIAIVDGLFEQTPAVWHKEILFALSQGIAVFGGGSMGALRAAELHPFGMVGVGRIFEDFASGRLQDDDEVAVRHAPSEDGYLAQSEAMVNIRDRLAQAREDGVLGAVAESALRDIAKRHHYPERDWETVFRDARAEGVDAQELARLRAFLDAAGPDLKARDAMAVLRTLAAWQRDPAPARPAPSFEFQPTLFWEHLREHFFHAGARSDTGVHGQRVRNHARLFDAQRDRLRERALLLHLAHQEMRRLGQPEVPVREALERLRRRRGLASAREFAEWRRGAGLDEHDCLALAQAEGLLARLEQRHAEQCDPYLLLALKMDGRYGAVVEQVERKWAALRAAGIDTPDEQDLDSADAALQWYQARHGVHSSDLESHVRELGLGSVRQFLDELAAEYLHHAHPPC